MWQTIPWSRWWCEKSKSIEEIVFQVPINLHLLFFYDLALQFLIYSNYQKLVLVMAYATGIFSSRACESEIKIPYISLTCWVLSFQWLDEKVTVFTRRHFIQLPYLHNAKIWRLSWPVFAYILNTLITEMQQLPIRAFNITMNKSYEIMWKRN